MPDTAEAIAADLAANRGIARNRTDKTTASAAEAASQFASVLQDAAVAPDPDARADAATARRSAAWDDFSRHPLLGSSEDGYPVVGETEEELALTWANAAQFAASHGQDMENASSIQTRLPVHDGVMGAKIGYRLATAVQLTGMTPIVDSDRTG